MIILAIAVFALVFAVTFLIKYNRSKLPDYLAGKKIDKYTDLMTNRVIYIATKQDPVKNG